MHRSTILSLLAASALSAVKADTTVTVDAASNWGTWQGWGVSLAWWAKAFGNRDDLATLFFTTKQQTVQGTSLPGLGFNIARYNAGASSKKSFSGSSMVVSPNISPTRQIDGFWVDWASRVPSSSSWDWTVDANQRAMLQKAKANGANIFELFSNSPMWWMCVNHNPSGGADATKDNLQTWNQQDFAVYLANVAQYSSQHWGINFQYVEAFNEPSTDYWKANGTQEGCHFEVSTMDAVLSYLKPELSTRGLSAKITASDETSYDAAVDTWNKMTSASKSSIAKINVHGYQHAEGRRDVLYSQAKQSNKVLWNSEYGDPDWSGKTMTTDLLLDFEYLHPTAWVYWQAIDVYGWGLLTGDNEGASITGPSAKYFVLAQFTRHIRPGMRILTGGNANTVAAYDATNKRLVVVSANWAAAQTVSFDLSKFSQTPKDGSVVTKWESNIDGKTQYVKDSDTHIQGKIFSSQFAQGSVQTFEVDGVVL